MHVTKAKWLNLLLDDLVISTPPGEVEEEMQTALPLFTFHDDREFGSKTQMATLESLQARASHLHVSIHHHLKPLQVSSVFKRPSNLSSIYTPRAHSISMNIPSIPVSQDPALNKMVTHSALRVAQGFALVAPPIYVVSSLILRRGTHPFSIRRLMMTSITATSAGAVVGAGLGYVRLKNQTRIALDDRVLRLAHNRTQVRTDDYSIIGSVLGALIIPTMFLKRAPLPLLILGGGSLGLGAGVLAHIAQSAQEGRDLKPEGMVGELPVIGGNRK